MDVVIAYVNCKDKVWVKNLLSISPLFFKYSHYYDYGTLRYTLRGIDKYMPYVNNVFLVVSNIESQFRYQLAYIDLYIIRTSFLKNIFQHSRQIPLRCLCTTSLD